MLVGILYFPSFLKPSPAVITGYRPLATRRSGEVDRWKPYLPVVQELNQKPFMSLDFHLTRTQPTLVFSDNITHNLGEMADAAGIYYALWRPEERGYKTASDIINVLETGLALLKNDREKFEKFDSPDGWGRYIHFVPFVEECLNACKEFPDAEISVSR